MLDLLLQLNSSPINGDVTHSFPANAAGTQPLTVSQPPAWYPSPAGSAISFQPQSLSATVARAQEPVGSKRKASDVSEPPSPASDDVSRRAIKRRKQFDETAAYAEEKTFRERHHERLSYAYWILSSVDNMSPLLPPFGAIVDALRRDPREVSRVSILRIMKMFADPLVANRYRPAHQTALLHDLAEAFKSLAAEGNVL
ncbi:hypothetical protein HDU96_006983 [Phlyctochytrium bullatum]|nr:hypothetical protein HDU96_006983 [Phlyctochytrium bullatum]